MRVLEIDRLKVSFRVPHGDVQAVDGASFTIAPGKTTALVGESGSGKSVIAQAIMGLLPHNARIGGGQIRFRDPDTSAAPLDLARLPANEAVWRRLRGERIGFVFQEPMTALSPLHTIGDQVGEAWLLRNPSADRAGMRAITQAMLERVGFADPDGALNRYPFELSGGLRQRAVIAMALICRPVLLIADEPTTALDVTLQSQILHLLKDLQAETGMAILFITHDLGVVAQVADEMAVMFRGRIMERGPAADLLRAPRHPYLTGLLAAVPEISAGTPKRLTPLCDVTPVAGTAGRSSPPALHPPDSSARPWLSARGLVKSFSVRHDPDGPSDALALTGVDLDIYRGECLALVGESGSGKSTMARLLVRAFLPDLGCIGVNDNDQYRDILAMDPVALKAWRRRVQYVFQDPFGSLNPRMTVFDILREPLVIHRICGKTEQRRRVDRLIRLVGLEQRHLARYPHSFSGGQRQRIGIARALALDPELLLLDEPVSALDASVQAQILNLLKDLLKRLDLTYVFVSHNLAVIDYMADRVAVLCRGRIVELAPRRALFASPRHPYTKALLAAVPRVAPEAKHDFGALVNARVSDPSAWPAPFNLRPGEPAAMVEVSPGHRLGVAWRHRQAAIADCA